MFVPGRHFQPILIFVSEAGAYLIVTTFSCSTQKRSSGHCCRLVRSTTEKQSSLVRTFINYVCKKLYKIENPLALLTNVCYKLVYFV
jgi:hypothetical protein